MKFINKFSLLMTILLVSLFSCNQEGESLSGLQGSVSFGAISLQFAPMGSPGDRISGNSTWVHVFPNSANLVFTNKVTKEQYTLEYNPNDFSVPYSITLPYGAYEYYSFLEGGVFSEYLPFEAIGEFFLDSQSLEISLEAETDYGLVTVKDQYVEKASMSSGDLESDLIEDQDKKYWFIYVKGETETTLNIKESFKGSTISRDIAIEANKHYNYVLKVNEGAAVITDLTIAPFELEEEEIIIGSNSKFFEENGTIKCPQASPGDKGEVNDKVYEAVDRALLIQRRDEAADLTCACTSLVTDMSWILGSEDDVDFNQPIGNWDVSNVTNMSHMFYRVYSFNQPLELWDVSKVTTMEGMFYNNSAFNQPIGNWDVSNVMNMSGMFMESAFRQPIGDWDVSNVINMGAMFLYASAFNQPLENWNVSKVKSMNSMFDGAGSFNQPLGKWDVSSVEKMFGMFRGADSFNQPIGDWDVSHVVEMRYMFNEAYSFNQNLTDWCVQNIQSEPDNFSFESALKNSNKPIWGTCPD